MKLRHWPLLALIVVALLAAYVARRSAPPVALGDSPTSPPPTPLREPPRKVAARVRASGVDASAFGPSDQAAATDDTWNQAAGVFGVVRTEDGRPVPGAFVALGDLDASEDTAITDAGGRFAIDQLPSYSTLQVAALRQGTVLLGQEPADGGPFKVDVTIRPHDAVEDRVCLVHIVGHDGTSISRAKAEAVGGSVREPWRWDTRNDVTAAGGWFPVRAKRWRDGERPVYLVGYARDENDSPLPYGPALITVDPLSADPVEVRLPPGTSIAGLVESAEGRPVAGICVSLTPPVPAGFDTERMVQPQELTTRTDESGRFRFGALANGPATVRIDPDLGTHGGCAAREVRAGDGEVILRLVAPADR